jgi:hypothetical protein
VFPQVRARLLRIPLEPHRRSYAHLCTAGKCRLDKRTEPTIVISCATRASEWDITIADGLDEAGPLADRSDPEARGSQDRPRRGGVVK